MVGKLVGIGVITIVIFILFLWQSNNHLKEKNKELALQIKNQTKAITIQKKVINLVKNIKAVDFDSNMQRMRNGEL